ncbi:MAG: universal stress protein [Leptolyngbyaceae cyanobacterium bins.302]|nr:universal stress protein [Leptolyngbyaceae cyanobacterium bins.302]
MFDKILVAVDRSKNGEKVLDAAISLAKATGASLMLLHVLSSEEDGYPVAPTLTTHEYYPVDGRLFEDYQKRWQIYAEEGLDLLRSYTDKATDAGVIAEFTQNSGNAGRTICELAQTWEADLIVIGRRGHSGWHELILGSVSNYVLHHAPCSVFTVQGHTQVSSDISQAKQAAMAS